MTLKELYKFLEKMGVVLDDETKNGIEQADIKSVDGIYNAVKKSKNLGFFKQLSLRAFLVSSMEGEKKAKSAKENKSNPITQRIAPKLSKQDQLKKDDLEAKRHDDKLSQTEAFNKALEELVSVSRLQLDVLETLAKLEREDAKQTQGGMNPVGAGIAGGIASKLSPRGISGIAKRVGPIGAALMSFDGAMRTIADKDLQDLSTGAKGVAGAIAGSKDGSILANAAKGALAGAIFGPLGAAIGGAIGGGLSMIGPNKIAKFLDPAFKVLFNKETWIGQKGIFTWLYNLPSNLYKDMLQAGKNVYSGLSDFGGMVWNSIKMPFTAEFWRGVGQMVSDSIGSQIEELKGKFNEFLFDANMFYNKLLGARDFIIDKLKQPFTKEYWTSVFAGKGDFVEMIGEKVGTVMSGIGDVYGFIFSKMKEPFTPDFWSNLFDQSINVIEATKEIANYIFEQLKKPFTIDFWKSKLEGLSQMWDDLSFDIDVNKIKDGIVSAIVPQSISVLGKEFKLRDPVEGETATPIVKANPQAALLGQVEEQRSQILKEERMSMVGGQNNTAISQTTNSGNSASVNVTNNYVDRNNDARAAFMRSMY